MPRKIGRPKGKTDGASDLTVRKVCDTADVSIGTFYHHFKNKDDLLMYFVKIISFDEIELTTPLENISERICELYMHIVSKYLSLGKEFMKGFYSTNNKALSAYMGMENGYFEEGTVMHRCEQELITAIEQGILNNDCDAHLMSADICTIVKGVIFEWCLTENDTDIRAILNRILSNYLSKKN